MTRSNTKTFMQTIRELINDTEIRSVNDIVLRHKGNWFAKDTMRFFSSRLSQEIYHSTQKKDTVYFITSERQSWGTPRKYTIRVYNVKTDKIATFGEFQKYVTLASAKTAVKYLQ